MFTVGVGPLSWIICSEIFPANIRSLAVSVATVFNWACSFAVTLSFNMIIQALGQHGLFLLYAAVCTMGAFFVSFLVPETRGLSLEEIQQMW